MGKSHWLGLLLGHCRYSFVKILQETGIVNSPETAVYLGDYLNVKKRSIQTNAFGVQHLQRNSREVLLKNICVTNVNRLIWSFC